MDAGIAQVRDEVMPAVQATDGCVGLSMLVDRESGRGIVTTAWRDDSALAASREAVRDMRARASAQLGDTGPEVAEWEIAVLHRLRPAPDGPWARVMWTESDRERLDDVLERMRTAVLPRLEQVPGFCSISLLVDRATGRGASAATYENRQALEDARTAARELRDAIVRDAGLRILDIAEFEVALAHLRVPETV
jgi:quinol monooxygenase YgiN